MRGLYSTISFWTLKIPYLLQKCFIDKIPVYKVNYTVNNNIGVFKKDTYAYVDMNDFLNKTASRYKKLKIQRFNKFQYKKIMRISSR